MSTYTQKFVDNPIQQEISEVCKHLSLSLITTCDEERVRGEGREEREEGRGLKVSVMECDASKLNM